MYAAIVLSLETVVELVVFLIIAGAVLGLLYYLIYFVESQFPSPPMALFCKVARVALVILAVLVLIGMLLSFAGHPILVLR